MNLSLEASQFLLLDSSLYSTGFPQHRLIPRPLHRELLHKFSLIYSPFLAEQLCQGIRLYQAGIRDYENLS